MCGLGYGPQISFVNCADIRILPQGQTVNFVPPDYQALYASLDGSTTTTTPALSTDQIKETTTATSSTTSSTPSITKSSIIIVTVPVVTASTVTGTGTTETPPTGTPKLVIGTTPSTNQVVTGNQAGGGSNVPNVPNDLGVFPSIFGSGTTGTGTTGNNWNWTSLIPLLLIGALIDPLLYTENRPSSFVLLKEYKNWGTFIPPATYGLPHYIPDPDTEPNWSSEGTRETRWYQRNVRANPSSTSGIHNNYGAANNRRGNNPGYSSYGK